MHTGAYTETYAAVKQYHKAGLRNRLRRVALDTLSLSNPFLAAALKRPRIQFIYIHHVFRDETEQLNALIRRLSEHHRFISYSEAVNRILQQQIDQPYIVFSSDDGLLNNMDAATVFGRYGIKACFFINPSTIGETDYSRIRSFCEQQLHFPPVRFMDWNDVASLLNRGHEIGSHTLNHINMGTAPQEVLVREIHESFRQISEKCGHVAHFAFPYGRFHHFNEFSRREVFAAGYQSVASAERGCHISGSIPVNREALLIRRDHVILDWKLPHMFWFFQQNSLRATPDTNIYTGWYA